jgi:hypothetical protein
LLSARYTPTGKDIHMLKVKGHKTIFQANEIWKQAWIATLISDKADGKPKLFRCDNSQYMWTKGAFHQKDWFFIKQFHTTNITGFKETGNSMHNNSGLFQYPLS